MSSCVLQAPSCITTAILNLTTHIEILILPLATVTTEARIYNTDLTLAAAQRASGDSIRASWDDRYKELCN